MSLFWKIVDSLGPDPEQARIVIGLGRGAGQSGKILDLEKLLGRGPEGAWQGDGQTEAVVVLATSSRACHETVARISELGISQLHAIYPQASHQPPGAAPGGAKAEKD